MSRDPPVRLALWVALAQCGDRKALNCLLRDHQQPLYAHIVSILGDRDQSYDVLQVSLMLIARRLSSLRDLQWFRAWAYRIATREAFRAARQSARDRALFDDVGWEMADVAADEPIYDPALVRACASQVEALPAGARLVVRLHYLEELTLVEVAEALELPVGTVKSRLAYGLSRLRENIGAAT